MRSGPEALWRRRNRWTRRRRVQGCAIGGALTEATKSSPGVHDAVRNGFGNAVTNGHDERVGQRQRRCTVAARQGQAAEDGERVGAPAFTSRNSHKTWY